MRARLSLQAEEKKMTSSSKRIIKLNKPVKKINILPVDQFGDRSKKFKEDYPSQNAGGSKKVIQVAEWELEEKLKNNYESGLEEGKALGYQQAKIEFGEKFERLETALKNFENEKVKFFEESESELLKWSLKVVGKILHEVPTNIKSLIKHSVQKAISMLNNESVVEIRMNADDIYEYEELEKFVEKSLPTLDKVTIKSDAKIARGGCIIFTDSGKVDAKIETQIDKVIQKVNSEINSFNNRTNAK